jgi:hypothetical protein
VPARGGAKRATIADAAEQPAPAAPGSSEGDGGFFPGAIERLRGIVRGLAADRLADRRLVRTMRRQRLERAEHRGIRRPALLEPGAQQRQHPDRLAEQGPPLARRPRRKELEEQRQEVRQL